MTLSENNKKRYARLAPWNLRNFKFAQEGDVVAFPNKTTNQTDLKDFLIADYRHNKHPSILNPFYAIAKLKFLSPLEKVQMFAFALTERNMTA